MDTARRTYASIAMLLSIAALMMAGLPQAAAAVTPSYSAYASALVAHADAVRMTGSRVLDAEVAFSGAALSSTGFASAIRNEVGRVVTPAAPAKRSHARGSAVEVGAGVGDDADNQLILAGKAESFAPTGAPDVKRIGPVEAAPIAWASLLAGSADAGYTNTCVLGADAARGTAAVADVEVLDAGSETAGGRLGAPVLSFDAPNPDRGTISTISRTRFVAQTDATGRVLGSDTGLMSEARATVAPVTLFKGTPTELTIEVLGEWVLRVVATGERGGAWVHYGPAGATPETPVVRIIQAGVLTNVLTLQQVLGNAGLGLDVPGVAEIAVGEDARAIGGAYESAPSVNADGTLAAAAVDVVRVKLLPSLGLADVRVGHLEARAAVPAGGIACRIPVSKAADPPVVAVGKTFTTTIGFRNPFECTISGLKVTDAISSEEFARYEPREISPGGSYTGNDAVGTIAWPSAGTLAPGAQGRVTAALFASDGPGEIADTATVTGVCGVGTATGSATVPVTVTGSATLQVPVRPLEVKGVKEPLAETGSGGILAAFVGLAAVAIGWALHQSAPKR